MPSIHKIVAAGRVHPQDFLTDYGFVAGTTMSANGIARIERPDGSWLELAAETPVEIKRRMSSEDVRAEDDAAVARARREESIANHAPWENEVLCETCGALPSEVVDGEPTGVCRECADDEAAREAESLDAAESGAAREAQLDGFAEWQRSKGLPETEQIDGYEVLRRGENEIERECEFPGGAFGQAAQNEAVRCWMEDLRQD